jgi:hypothetical protein
MDHCLRIIMNSDNITRQNSACKGYQNLATSFSSFKVLMEERFARAEGRR